jgi:DNA-directed RNA polymerase subunit RPC12/RpoP
MLIQFTCECGQQLQAREEHAGRVIRCPKCGHESTVPAREAIRPAPDDLPRASRRRAEDDDRYEPGRGDREESRRPRASRVRSRAREEDEDDDRDDWD